MTHLGPRAQALVDAARRDGPTAADRARIKSALSAKLVVLPNAAPAAGSSAGAVGGSGSILGPLLAVGAILGALGFGGGIIAARSVSSPVDQARQGVGIEVLRRSSLAAFEVPAPPSLPVAVAARAEPPPALEVASADLKPAVPPIRRSAVEAPRPREPEPPVAMAGAEPARAPEAPSNTLLAETRILRSAQAAVVEGKPDLALQRIDELANKYPDGLLKEERFAARVLALCAAGRPGDARVEADRFLSWRPLSIQAAHVKASCAFAPTKK